MKYIYWSLRTYNEVMGWVRWILGEDWQAARKQMKSKMHILDPMGIDMKLQKALNPDDIRLAQ